MAEPERITSPYAPDLGEVRAFLERMIRGLRFVGLVAAILAFVAMVCEVNGVPSKKVAEQRRRRPRSESLERLERQLLLPLAMLGGAPVARPVQSPRDQKRRNGSHPRPHCAARAPATISRAPSCSRRQRGRKDAVHAARTTEEGSAAEPCPW